MDAFARDLLSRISWSCVIVLILSWLVQQTTRRVVRPEHANEVLLQGLAPGTKRSYLRAFDDVHTWAARRTIALDSPTAYDSVSWPVAQGLNMSRAELTLAALERLVPPLKRNLPWSKARLVATAVAHIMQHHPLMLWEIASGLGWALTVIADHAIAQAFVLKRLTGMRAGEALRLKPQDITPSLRNLSRAWRLGHRAWHAGGHDIEAGPGQPCDAAGVARAFGAPHAAG